MPVKLPVKHSVLGAFKEKLEGFWGDFGKAEKAPLPPEFLGQKERDPKCQRLGIEGERQDLKILPPSTPLGARKTTKPPHLGGPSGSFKRGGSSPPLITNI